jgi:adenosylcobinamide-GDP ribazoletransferase
LTVIIFIFITGGFHLDGFVDLADGFSSGSNKDKILEIMRDNRVGALGVISVICLILLKISFLNEIPATVFYPALILMPVISRWTIVFNADKYPYARKTDGLGEPFAKFAGTKELVLATLFTLVFAGLLMQFKGLIIWFAIMAVLFLLGRWISKKIGGMTGDAYGAMVEITEVLFLIFVYLINLI